MLIRPAGEQDDRAVWRVVEPTIRAGERNRRIGVSFDTVGATGRIGELKRAGDPLAAAELLRHRQRERRLRAEGGDRLVGADEISEALFREVLDGPDARIGQRAFLAKETPRFRWAGEDFWARRSASSGE